MNPKDSAPPLRELVAVIAESAVNRWLTDQQAIADEPPGSHDIKQIKPDEKLTNATRTRQ